MNRRHLGLALVVCGLALAMWIQWRSDSASDAPAQHAEPTQPAEATPAPGPTPPRTPAAPSPTFSASELKVIAFSDSTEEHAIVERRYDPPLLMRFLEQRQPRANLDSPERLMEAYYSAMQRGDWDEWSQLFDPKSWAYFLSKGTPKQKYLDGWAKNYRGRAFVLTRRIDFPGYSIIYGRRSHMSDAAVEAKIPHSVKKDGDRWFLTHDLLDHPVYGYDSMRDNVTVRSATP